VSHTGIEIADLIMWRSTDTCGPSEMQSDCFFLVYKT